MIIRRYNKATDESKVMQMISEEEGWDYANENLAEKYKVALETSITYVACQDDVLCGYSRSLDDFGEYIYVCDLLVMPAYRGKWVGRKLMEYYNAKLELFYNKAKKNIIFFTGNNKINLTTTSNELTK